MCGEGPEQEQNALETYGHSNTSSQVHQYNKQVTSMRGMERGYLVHYFADLCANIYFVRFPGFSSQVEALLALKEVVFTQKQKPGVDVPR